MQICAFVNQLWKVIGQAPLVQTEEVIVYLEFDLHMGNLFKFFETSDFLIELDLAFQVC